MLKNMKLGMRLGLSFGLILALLAIVGSYAIVHISQLSHSIELVVKDRMLKTRQCNNILDNLNIQARVCRNMLLLNEPALIQAEKARMDSTSAVNTKIMDSLETSIKTEEGKKLFGNILELRKPFTAIRSQYVDIVLQGKKSEATALLFGDYRKAQTDYMAAIKDLIDFQTDLAAKDGDESFQNATNLEQVLIGSITALIIFAIFLAWILTRSLTKPIGQCIEVAEKIARGETDIDIKSDSTDETGMLLASLRQMVGVINSLIGDMKHMSDEHTKGDIDVQIPADKFQGAFRTMASGVNEMVFGHIAVKKKAMACIAEFGKGNLDAPLERFPGKKAFINENIEKMRENIKALVADVGMLTKAAVEGKLATRADAVKHEGDFRKIVQGVNDTLDAVIGPLNVTAKYVDDISKGVIPPTITDNYNGDFNLIKNNLNAVVKMMNDLLKETDIIIKAAADGELDKRADTTKFLGGWNQLVKGVNDTITNIVNPLMVTANYVDNVSKGVIPPEITDTYKGQYNLIKNNLNAVVKMMSLLLKETDTLVSAALTGSLSTRAKADLFQGGWNQLVSGVNKTLDAVLEPINEAAGVLDAVAARDLTARVKGDYKGDHAKIKLSLNTAVENLESAMSQVTEATQQVASASGQISSGSQSLAQGANEQASSLEEISASLEEMSSMTRQNADNSLAAKNLAGEADGNAKIGTEAMNRMSSAINRIKESSDQTAKIVKTIDEIAMQTNLLALNAAVEAARAGEAGRGFAVVAEEVRNLAQRSAQAAKNTADMIGESVKNAEDGVKISVEVSSSFDKIATSARKVNDLIAEIAAASKEQSQGIKEVNDAVVQMDKVTQQNAANAEESASASEELSSQAQELQAMVGQFKIAGGVVVVKAKSVMHHRAIAPPQTVSKAASQKHAKLIHSNDAIPMDDDALREF